MPLLGVLGVLVPVLVLEDSNAASNIVPNRVFLGFSSILLLVLGFSI